MELKVIFGTVWIIGTLWFQSHLYGIESQDTSHHQAPRRFQSHLYGIESQISKLGADIDEGFNRTFMELKVVMAAIPVWTRTVSIAPLWNWKRLSKDITGKCSSVSIAPLWNWKIDNLHMIDRYLIVSIAPLWNWKRVEVVEEVLRKCFNRTFMELKVVW